MRRASRIGSVTTAAILLPVAFAAAGTTIHGTPGDDRLSGTGRAETIVGRGGDDVVRGRGGADRLRGGPGRDRLVGGRGFDELTAGRHRDRVRVRDGRSDFVDCGPGRDRVFVDQVEDGVLNCERVIEP